jgi:dTDP-4-amino-4,6-dideoxygalactose transaminase
VAVANGTAALHLAYLSCGVRPQDEVIQPALNFAAAANMTIASGAEPIFADITSLDEPVIDPSDVERKITHRTKAVVVMHYGGYVCDMTSIRRICDDRGLALIEDACHAVGAVYRNHSESPPHGKKAGAIGDVGCFSFFSNKNLATGEGGMVVTDRDDVAQQVRLMRCHGMTTLSWDRHRGHARAYDILLNGYNYRMDDIRAALGRAQLSKLEQNNARRRELVSLYREELKHWPGWSIPFENHVGVDAAHLMILVAPSETLRCQVMEVLADAGIQTSMHYPCLTNFTGFQRFNSQGLERSLKFAKRGTTLPLFPGLLESSVKEICSIIHSVRAAESSRSAV